MWTIDVQEDSAVLWVQAFVKPLQSAFSLTHPEPSNSNAKVIWNLGQQNWILNQGVFVFTNTKIFMYIYIIKIMYLYLQMCELNQAVVPFPPASSQLHWWLRAEVSSIVLELEQCCWAEPSEMHSSTGLSGVCLRECFAGNADCFNILFLQRFPKAWDQITELSSLVRGAIELNGRNEAKIVPKGFLSGRGFRKA